MYLLAPDHRIAIKLLALKVSQTYLLLKVCTFGTWDYLSAERWGFEHPPPSYPNFCLVNQGLSEVRRWWVKQDQNKTSFLQFHREINRALTLRHFCSVEITWILRYLCTKGLCDCKVLLVLRRQKFLTFFSLIFLRIQAHSPRGFCLVAEEKPIRAA